MENIIEKNFIEEMVEEDLKNQVYKSVKTRFPPEPNGYLHIGHAKAICVDFGIAEKFGGKCNLRMDDTNPSKEDVEYVESIKEDIKWLGFNWDGDVKYASDYYEKFYECAVKLIKMGLAYVCDLSPEEMREYRGTLKEPGKESPYRNRSIEENLILFEKMRAGEFPDGSKTLRAKIDMASGNINMRDPVIYRIMRVPHHRTGDKWCIYPMYDFAHPLSDYFEGITHSLCTLEFEDHRPLYDWFLEKLFPEPRPRQIEFARLNITYTVLSKRKLLALVEEGHVDGWDDPRMPTISGLRRRGYTPEAIKNFVKMVGVAKANSTVELSMLEYAIREDLNKRALRRMVVINPLKVIIENYPADKVEYFEAENNPEDPSAGTRKVAFSREIYIEKEDFMENPPKDYFRLSPGKEVRLKYAYYITCKEVVKDKNGEIVELICTYDPESRGGGTPDGRLVKGTLHWVSVKHSVPLTVNLYDKLFLVPSPGEGDKDFREEINRESLVVKENCFGEEIMKEAKVGENYQFLRLGYFCLDSKAAKEGKLIFNRTVTLKDTWAKIQKKGK
ncbi:MAG: glutamine--tRNA ligase/YqeY domain fusion protein [Brevinematales bacterium]